MLGIIPAAGTALRMQPLAGSKELLPLGWGPGGRVRVIVEYVLERMLRAGAERICVVISPHKADLLAYLARSEYAARLFFLVQPEPLGLCDAVFRAAPYVEPAAKVLLGLPDTIWFPRAAFTSVPDDSIHLITFPVLQPQEFDAVLPGEGARVAAVQVKRPGSSQRRIWGAITAPGREFLELERFWRQHGAQARFLGHLLNDWIGAGGTVSFDRQGTRYWDIGTPRGYQLALEAHAWEGEDGPSPLAEAIPATARPEVPRPIESPESFASAARPPAGWP
ncbi:MAG: sugar phosphate nucleotidyltransferase [Terriglobales bacterium]